MSDIAIRVEGLGKRYRIGRKKEKYRTLRDTVADWFSFKRTGDTKLPESEIWALRDAQFELKQGRVLGVIGSNGAGKSTLLKLLSRITEPTEGWADLQGRVGSLLEVGTGFHQELTGRENVFLNGAILGMPKKEIRRNFDEIVAFSGVEEFIDTPVKRYSTGMYLRLAFSVAAHLEPDILLVDEVLAVGDVAFQKKCMGKIGEVVDEGRTVLLVSHNMAAIKQLADEVILVNRGHITFQGAPDIAIQKYFENSAAPSGQPKIDMTKRERSGSGAARITRLEVIDKAGASTTTLGVGQPFEVIMEVEAGDDRVPILIPGVELRTAHGMLLLALRCDTQQILLGPLEPKTRTRVRIRVPGVPVYPGDYTLDVWIAAKIAWKLDHIVGAMSLNFVSQGVYTCESNLSPRFERGLFISDCQWTTEALSESVAVGA